ncbi:transferase family protein [Lojkania enalia]|uniref:Transferase family protein n=1 Tax=Lojkania enalia TaxID=147567 RepID=A0A9P4K006_9PLEO|nr:transferase family protein [Didymosphaeria enalia]
MAHNSPAGLGLSLRREESSVPRTPSSQARDTSIKILDIIFEHALNKFDDSKERLAAGMAKFLSVIDQFVLAGERVEACLPAFPFKSANKVYKVLGSLPDKAEELALQRLNNMCVRIKQVYKPGARVTIISDGITYNDLLSISDRDTWAYGEALRQMAADRKFTYIGFSRLKDLLDFPLPDKLREITYVANCTNFRRLLLNKYGRPDIDIDKEITNNPDTKLTYLGYRKFLESDLKHIFTLGENRGSNQYKRDVKYLAKQMLFRGYAFAGAVKNAFPNHLRLSIHESIGEHKVSMSLLNTKTGYTTPWHCSVAILADGEWVSAPMGEFQNDPRLELVYEHGRPSYFKEKLQNTDMPWISEANAGYLQAPKLFNGTRSGYSSPSVTSIVSGRSTPSPQTPATSFVQSTGPLPRIGSIVKNSRAPYMNGTSGPAYGRRLIPQIMDQLAAAHPNRAVFSITKVSGASLELRDLSAYAFTKAVDKTAWWLYDQVGKSSSVRPVGYIGPHDLRHILLTYACVKVGYAALYLSPKNSTEGSLAVLEATKCEIWAKASEAAAVPLVKDILQKRSMKLLELPLLEDLLNAEQTKPFPYNKTFDEASTDPFCYLHTSGSTGVPKPIPWSHGLIGTMDAVRLLPPVEGDEGLVPWTSDWKEGDRIYSSFPMCHGAGIIMDILMPALFGLHCILGPPNVIPNISLIESLAEHAKIDIWSMVPSLVDELGETPDVLAKFRSSKFICASGGPVSPVSAGKVNNVIRVLNLTGTTEGLFIGNLVVDREDWFWFAFHPYSGFEFKEVEAGTYEHWVHRNEHATLFQGIFHTFPDKESINFKDLYMRHPQKPNLWAFKGRNDDLIVLSNGYKILPLEIEALISTHPAINGCLVVGSNKLQAGLLIELKDPLAKTDELVESIWSKIESSMSSSRHTVHLLRDYVIFAQPNKPFVRTDKGTVKRRATLMLYDDYIERFYSSRSNETSFVIDTSSASTMRKSIQEVLASSLPEIQQASPDDDLFALGLDSLGVSAAVNAIRAAIKGLDKLAPRHLYANPTLAKFTAALEPLVAEAKGAGNTKHRLGDRESKMHRMIAQRKAHQSFRLNPFDYVNPNHYMGLVFYFPLRADVTFEETFANMQAGLNRTLELIPALGGKMIKCSEDEIGYTKGDLCVAIPPFGSPARDRLVFKDLSGVLPSFEKLREGGFVPSAFKDELVLRQDTFPQLPGDILVAQANFIKGGCILAVDLNHCCLDGVGAIIAIKVWAENCKYLQGDLSATCEWYDAESFNHSLPEVLHELEGYARPADEVDPDVWGFLPFVPSDDFLARQSSRQGGPLGRPPLYPLHSVWPLPAAKRKMDTTLFLIPPKKIELLKQDVMNDPEANGVITSISDIVQAFLWRSALRARYHVAKDNGREFGPDDCSILELPTDGRPYFSSLLPSTYMGSLLILNRTSMPVEELCAPETSIARIAHLLRGSAARMTPSLVHDAFTLLQSLPDHSRFSTANMGLEHMHAMISNMMLFQTSDISFGEGYFANGGSPETMRPQLERGSGRFRFLVVFPMKADGGVELVLGTFPEERDMLARDDEFTRYAQLLSKTMAFTSPPWPCSRDFHHSRASHSRSSVEVPLLSPASIMSAVPEDAKPGAYVASSEHSAGSPVNDERPDADAQAGVQDIEATTLVWSKTALIVAYIILWIIYFVETMLTGVTIALGPYVTSAFALHSLTPTVYILSGVIGGVTNLTIAKIIDVFGRSHGFLFCLCLGTVGLIMMAACNGVEAYAAAMIFHTVGNNGVQYIMSVFIADTTKLRNRGLMQALMNSASLVTCWLAGPVSEGFLNGPGWRWCFGMFSILVPFATLPLFGLLTNNYLKAKRMGLVPVRTSSRNFMQSFIHYCREFDAVGLLLLSAGVALFLLPFNLYAFQGRGWGSPLVISMLVVGIVLMLAFVVWEKFFAPVSFIPYKLLLDRTVLGACLLCTCLFMSYYVWNSYFGSFLQVVQGLSVQNASYVNQSYTVLSVLVAVSVGYLIHRTGYFKTISLIAGIPLSILGQGLMIHFRSPGNVGYIVMCQIFISISQGILVITDEIAILAAGSHEHVAVSLAIVSIFGSIGGAIGMTIASSIWQDIIPKRLMEYLPAEDLPNLLFIYGDIETQLAYPEGSPTRLAIQHAYGDAMLRLLAASTAIWVVGTVGVLLWRNINVIGIKQAKGHVW